MAERSQLRQRLRYAISHGVEITFALDLSAAFFLLVSIIFF
jgi:hypothetical protein